jgi:hypothetical protein
VPNAFRSEYIYYSSKEFTKNSNLKAYFDQCMASYKTKCRQELESVFERYFNPYLQDSKDFMSRMESLEKQCTKAESAEAEMRCLEDFKAAKNMEGQCKTFRRSLDVAIETFNFEKATLLEDLKKQTPQLSAAVIYFGDIEKLAQKRSAN